MARQLLPESAIDPAIENAVGGGYDDTVNEVRLAVETHPVVVVGMARNPYCKKACKNLEQAGKAYHYLEYGGYFKEWHRRLAIKMWSGWPTFPMVFIDGKLIGGNQELEKKINNGEV